LHTILCQQSEVRICTRICSSLQTEPNFTFVDGAVRSISVPRCDAVYDPPRTSPDDCQGNRTIEFGIPSAAGGPPSTFTNNRNAWLDLSWLYGLSAADNQAIREGSGGRIRIDKFFNNSGQIVLDQTAWVVAGESTSVNLNPVFVRFPLSWPFNFIALPFAKLSTPFFNCLDVITTIGRISIANSCQRPLTKFCSKRFVQSISLSTRVLCLDSISQLQLASLCLHIMMRVGGLLTTLPRILLSSSSSLRRHSDMLTQNSGAICHDLMQS
jgi:hypothetical protein